MKTVSLFACLLLSACCHGQPVMEPVIAKIPVPTPCVAETVPEPEWNVDRLAPGAPLPVKLAAALSDLELSRGYSEELRAELDACSG